MYLTLWRPPGGHERPTHRTSGHQIPDLCVSDPSHSKRYPNTHRDSHTGQGGDSEGRRSARTRAEHPDPARRGGPFKARERHLQATRRPPEGRPLEATRGGTSKRSMDPTSCTVAAAVGTIRRPAGGCSAHKPRGGGGHGRAGFELRVTWHLRECRRDWAAWLTRPLARLGRLAAFPRLFFRVRILEPRAPNAAQDP